MAEIKSKAPLPLTMHLIESEVFSMRTRAREAPAITEMAGLVHEIAICKDKKARDTLAVWLAAECVRVIEEVK